jgi:hypothetical protein
MKRIFLKLIKIYMIGARANNFPFSEYGFLGEKKIEK